MIFHFLKYIKPIWYFNLKPEVDYAYFPSEELLDKYGVDLALDANFVSDIAQRRDLAWRGFQLGCIQTTGETGMDIWRDEHIPLEDEYCFLRKYFHKAWVFYVLVIRLTLFHNPLKELKAFFKTQHIKRLAMYKNHIPYKDYESFASDLIIKRPLVSIVIPTLNRYEYLKNVFKDLERQTYKHFEVIVVDQTDDFKEEFYLGWNLDLKYWHQKEKALWRARNEAIALAKGDYILLYDDDSRVEVNWIEQHLKTLDFFKADVSSGVSLSVVGAEIPEHYSYFRWSDQLDTGNVLLKKSIFEKVGYFDRQFEGQRMGDGEFGLRCYLAGYKNISNPKAKRMHLKAEQGGLRQMGSWDGWRPKKLFGPRPVPSVLYLTRTYFGKILTLYFVLQGIMPSLVSYKFKNSRVLKLISFCLIPLFLPFVLVQVLISWRLSTHKMNKGIWW
ncbi:glycosyltransferase family 2 protein [Aestuariibaculum suncheonense]|uniref:Glycosyltransferase family 2 protein n=1 Tax=Aestuariibaculum suncheonense TaxID=1028745 RepID=A0A8J6UC76_9FLAO|nr:glycosyltransferase family A protein [Aestuariibaculum suncheonense]MBD0836998.1 glycosyltransferase family 2 protein [Aestuariibaculum suncheonense]